MSQHPNLGRQEGFIGPVDGDEPPFLVLCTVSIDENWFFVLQDGIGMDQAWQKLSHK